MTRFGIPFLLPLAMAFCADIPQVNRWVQVSKDMAGARPGSAIRYVPESRAFFLWG